MKLSVELEPPAGAYTYTEEREASIEDEIAKYIGRVEMISITNRPVFGLSAITMAKRVHRLVNKHKQTRVSLHLTTRLSHHDMFRNVLDAHRIGLTDLLPILGDPRGPKDFNYFKNGFDILGFISYLKTGRVEFLTSRFREMLKLGRLVKPIENAKFNIGSVVDLNPVKFIDDGKKVNIRDQQILYAQKKERSGAEYLISQGIFEAQDYFDFVDAANLSIPIIVGLLPARSRLIELFGLPISPLKKQTLRAQLTSRDEAIVGNQMTREVFDHLEQGGCKQVHIYSIGNPNNFLEITGIDDLDKSHNRLNFEDQPNNRDIESR